MKVHTITKMPRYKCSGEALDDSKNYLYKEERREIQLNREKEDGY